MPPKHQKTHLKNVRESKAQKNEQDFNVFDETLNFDVNRDDNDSETIIDSEDEYVLSKYIFFYYTKNHVNPFLEKFLKNFYCIFERITKLHF